MTLQIFRVYEVVSNRMGVEKFVMMTRLTPWENCSQLIKGVDKAGFDGQQFSRTRTGPSMPAEDEFKKMEDLHYCEERLQVRWSCSSTSELYSWKHWSNVHSTFRL